MVQILSRSVLKVGNKYVENVGTKQLKTAQAQKGQNPSSRLLKKATRKQFIVRSSFQDENSSTGLKFASNSQIQNKTQIQYSNLDNTNSKINLQSTDSYMSLQKEVKKGSQYFADKIENWPKKSDMYLVRSDGNSCAREFVRGSGKLTFAFPSTNQHLLIWRQRPKTVLIIKKLGSQLLPEFKQVVEFLGGEQGMEVIVEPADFEMLKNIDKKQNFQTNKTQDNIMQSENSRNNKVNGNFVEFAFANNSINNVNFQNNSMNNSARVESSNGAPIQFENNQNFEFSQINIQQNNTNSNQNSYLHTFRSDEIDLLADIVDFVVCLGGDGVILHVSDLFKKTIPPIVSFHLGSLGFLTNHEFSNFRRDLTNLIDGSQDLQNCQFDDTVQGVNVALRMRLQCQVFHQGILRTCHDVLNEVVIDRGVNSYLSNIEVYESGKFITTVQGDGVMLATPTGSTAYSVAAGGSMVHPNVSSILFTPICPHSLSFKPIILPDYAVIELRVPESARASARVSFDGKHSVEVEKGDWVRVRMSTKPVPTINMDNLTNDWFGSLDRCFGWSNLEVQKPLD